LGRINRRGEPPVAKEAKEFPFSIKANGDTRTPAN